MKTSINTVIISFITKVAENQIIVHIKFLQINGYHVNFLVDTIAWVEN